jgi:hypothetical protein
MRTRRLDDEDKEKEIPRQTRREESRVAASATPESFPKMKPSALRHKPLSGIGHPLYRIGP